MGRFSHKTHCVEDSLNFSSENTDCKMFLPNILLKWINFYVSFSNKMLKSVRIKMN